MDRIEPRHEPDLKELTFRRSPRWSAPAADSRFALGVGVFLLVALIYPWYSYKVQAYLLGRDARNGIQEFAEAMEQETQALAIQQAKDVRASSEQATERRIAAVRVMGISDGNPPLVVVEFGQSNMMEADETICRQAARWLRRPVDGSVIRVQRARSSGTSAQIQELACP
jgi:hypothetical protein